MSYKPLYTWATIARRVIDAATALGTVSPFELNGKPLRIAHIFVIVSHCAEQKDRADAHFLTRR